MRHTQKCVIDIVIRMERFKVQLSYQNYDQIQERTTQKLF